MAYIIYDQNLRWHWKVERLAQDLSLPKAHALGLVSALWLWAVPNARDGFLDRFTDREISAAAGWEGDEKILRVLLRKHNLIEAENRDYIHEWHKFGLRLLNQANERMQRYRQNKKSRPPEEPRLEPGRQVNGPVAAPPSRPFPKVDFTEPTDEEKKEIAKLAQEAKEKVK